MKITFTRVLCLVLVLLTVVACFAGCNKDPEPTPTPDPGQTTPPASDPTTPADPGLQLTDIDPDYVVDYTNAKSIYEAIGDKVTIDYVVEDPATGLCYVKLGGQTYELGMDFLSMAMVYKTTPITGNEKFDTADEIYLEWWRLYIQRWNYLVPEIPLYSNVYYDLYRDTITGFETNPFFGPADAIIYATMKDANAESKFILGSSTELSGMFRYSAWAVSSPAASNQDIETLTSGLSTVTTDKNGQYIWNNTAVKSHNEVVNDDGTKTYTVEIHDDLKFSDGSAITAKNYLYSVLAFSTPVGAAAQGRDKQSGMSYVGYEDFAAYAGEGDPVAFSGIKLLGDYTFSVTVAADYLPYYYDIAYAGFTPTHKNLWCAGEADIATAADGSVYLTAAFYAKTGDVYNQVASLQASAANTDHSIPYSGAYYVESYDAATMQATLKKNTYFKGTYDGTKPGIETLVYVKAVSETMFQQLAEGGIDILTGITGGTDTDTALAMVKDGGYAEVHYDRAGYGKLAFRCDLGPAMFTSVRQAVAYCLDTNGFAKAFTAGYGGTVYGPYCQAQWMYNATTSTLNINTYAISVDEAIDVLVADGWVYNAEGGAYTEGVRYKKLTAAEATADNIAYQSKSGTYKTVKIGDDYYLPLVLNWYCSLDNEVSEMLKTSFAYNSNIAACGMVVEVNQGDFTPLLGEYYQYAGYGYTGPAMYNAFNLATGYNSAVYDYSWNWTVDDDFYDDYSICYLKDAADMIPAA